MERELSDLNSASQEVLVPVKILQFQDMLNESVRFWDIANGLYLLFSRSHSLASILNFIPSFDFIGIWDVQK